MQYPRWDIYNHPKAIARATTSSVEAPEDVTVAVLPETAAAIPEPIGVSPPKTLIPATSTPTLWTFVDPVLKFEKVATPTDNTSLKGNHDDYLNHFE